MGSKNTGQGFHRPRVVGNGYYESLPKDTGTSWAAIRRRREDSERGPRARTSRPPTACQWLYIGQLSEAVRNSDWEAADEVLRNASACPDSASVVSTRMYDRALNVLAICKK